jgi:hypothetical protein
MEEAAHNPVPDGKFVKVACVHKSVHPNYRVVAACGGLLSFVGASAFALGMAIHNEWLANQHVPEARKSSIYYCATGLEIPMHEPCGEMKGQRDILCLPPISSIS